MNKYNSRGFKHTTENIVQITREREFRELAPKEFLECTAVTESLIQRLDLRCELQGHKGCVNCLEWSEDGRILVSGSDDTKIMLWDAFRQKRLDVLSTRHIGNIFSVRILPNTNCSKLVTGAGDMFVTVMNVERSSTSGDSVPSEPLLHCRCHAGRVKRIATAPDQPDMFWSAGEDGLILQYDLREPHGCGRNSTVLVDLTRHMGWIAEAKCAAINPTRTYLMAVGADDAYARLYDRRMMTTSSLRSDHAIELRNTISCLSRISARDHSIPESSVQYFAPGHLRSVENMGGGVFGGPYKMAATYVSFSPDGNDLLVNLGGEHIYLYDINNLEKSSAKLQKPSDNITDFRNGFSIKKCCSGLSDTVPTNIFKDERVRHVNPSVKPQCACQYTTKADYLLKRKWLGDYYAAARHYLKSIYMLGVKNNHYALVGLVFALIRLKWTKAAEAWFSLIEYKPDTASPELKSLEDMLEKLKNEEKSPAATEESDGSDHSVVKISAQEETWRSAAGDYDKRFVGHCNTTTDIKEAVFFGSQYIAAGSDDGAFYIWRRSDSTLLRVLQGDSSIVNCVQPHPYTCLIATSGIEPVVKLWHPRPEDGSRNNYIVPDIAQAAEVNQQRMAMDPFDTMLVNIGYQVDVLNPHFNREMSVCRTS